VCQHRDLLLVRAAAGGGIRLVLRLALLVGTTR
jgi:hypothetical protein